MTMQGSYIPELVLLSVVIAVLASYAAFHAAGRLKGSLAKTKNGWALSGGFCLGSGIWSMHFIGMLAYDMDMTVTYDPVLFIVSIVCAVTASWLAFLILKFFTPRTVTHLIGAVVIGAGIVSMHYIGMESMRMGDELVYNPLIVALSIFIAFIASFTALQLLSAVPAVPLRMKQEIGYLGSSVLMGTAIAGMHYTGMAGTSYYFDGAGADPAGSSFIGSGQLSLFIGTAILAILAITIMAAVFDRKIETSRDQYDMLEGLYQSIIQSANDAVVTSDQDGTIISWNEAAAGIFGYKKEEVIGRDLTVIIPESYLKEHCAGFERHKNTGKQRVIGSVVELEGLHKDGHTFPVELSLSCQHRGGSIYYTGIIRDISERVKQQERIQELIYRDDLTQLPNRRMLNEHLQKILDQKSSEQLAVLFIDLDRFKQVNDVFGHRTGDKLLVTAAERMTEHLHNADLLSRQSGDEFVLVMPDASEYQAGQTAEMLLKDLNTAFFIDEKEMFVSASIGISMYPDDGMGAEELMKHADTAMYKSKRIGASQYRFFTSDMNEEVSKKMVLESDLRKGMEQEEFVLYYQPQVSVATNEVKGYEALIRWHHPELGMVSPAEFIPLAEETGLIIPLGRWILREACRQAEQWRQEGRMVSRISVNISPLQFRQPDFISMINEILEETGLPPNYLELEITESTVQDPEYSVPLMNDIRDMDVNISLDDFGTGYSSLSYLKDFPLNTLKIDKTFIDHVESPREKAIVDAIIHMAHQLEFNVIAEGIENGVQLEMLSRNHCEEYQGYYYSPPLSPTAIKQ
ncbi:EAL domain-containing protein [Salibacterium sp. K-3]